MGFMDGIKAIGSGVKYTVVEGAGLVGSMGGSLVRKFNDAVGITGTVQRVDDQVQNITDAANRAINLGEQAVANATDLADRATTNLTAVGLTATNHTAALGNRGMREVETWGDFLRSHTVSTTVFVGGIASEAVAVTMHRAHRELCEGSVGILCSGLADTTLIMYNTGIACIFVAGAYLFYMVSTNRMAPQRTAPMAVQPAAPRAAVEDREAAADLNPAVAIDGALVRTVNLSIAAVEATMPVRQAPVVEDDDEFGGANEISDEQLLEISRKLAEAAQKTKATREKWNRRK